MPTHFEFVARPSQRRLEKVLSTDEIRAASASLAVEAGAAANEARVEAGIRAEANQGERSATE